MCTSRRSPASCVIFRYTETDAQRKGTGRGEDTFYDWHDCGCFPIISSYLSIIPSLGLSRIRRLNTDSSTKINLYITSLILSRGQMKHTDIPKMFEAIKILQISSVKSFDYSWLVSQLLTKQNQSRRRELESYWQRLLRRTESALKWVTFFLVRQEHRV